MPAGAISPIPSREELAELARVHQGNLEHVPFPLLLQALALEERTVELELSRRLLEKRVMIEAGVPVDARSNLAHETLGRFLMAEGKLAEADFAPALAQSATAGVPLGEILVERGLLTPEELFRALQQNLAKKLLDLFTWTEGAFRILHDVPGHGSALKVKVPQLVLTGITRFSPQKQVDVAVGALVGKTLTLHPNPPTPLDDIRLGAGQQVLIEALRPGRRIDELAAATALPFEELTRTVYALAILGIVVSRDRLTTTGARPIVVPEAAPAPTPAPPPESAPPVQAEHEALRNRVVQSYLAFRRQDAFDLLTLPESATTGQIQQRYLAFAETYAPWRFAGPEVGDLADKARDLFLAGARAFAELSDPAARATLLTRRRNLQQERDRPAARPSQIHTDLLDPELQFKKGLDLLAAGRPREALAQLEFAADCDPANSRYRAELAFCRFQLSPTGGAKAALEDLTAAIRMDAQCGIAHYYAGEVHRQAGNEAEAEAAFRRALKLMAPDRRPIEGLKALKVKLS